jgi:hypothetical protein
MSKFPTHHPVVASYPNTEVNRRALGMDRLPEHVYGDPSAPTVTHNTSTGRFDYVDRAPRRGDLDWDAERGVWVCLDEGDEGVEFE